MSVTFLIDATTDAQFIALRTEGAPDVNMGTGRAIDVLRAVGAPDDDITEAINVWPCGSLDPALILATPAARIPRGDEMHRLARAALALGLRVGYA